VLVPLVFPLGTVFAQTSGYTITDVDHSIEVTYTGQVIIRDTIHVTGQVTDGFTIGLPAKYSVDILEAVAYDTNNVYQVNLGVQLGSQGGFYGAEINFNGHSPSVFTVVFILSNSVLSVDPNSGDYILDYPAYPGLTQNVATCNVTLTLPGTPTDILITKDDGAIEGDNYMAQNLPAYTYSVGSADITIANGTIVLADISQLDRQINIDPTGKVNAVDSYQIINNSTDVMTGFALELPSNAQNVIVKDQSGVTLSTSISTTRDILIANATLETQITNGELTTLTAAYNLPSATVQGSQYTLQNFSVFPDVYYYIDHATFSFNPPTGATIVTPQLSSLGSSSSVTRSSFQDTLTINKDGVSYIDYEMPQGSIIQFAYDYNPVWVSFLPTFWVSALAVIGCIGAVIYKQRKPNEKQSITTTTTRSSTAKAAETASTQGKQTTQTGTGQYVSQEELKEFTDDYEEKKELTAEIKSLDSKAQKGKIQRRQYKVQRKAIETRLQTIEKNTNRLKNTFKASSPAYADLMKQLDTAEADLNDADENLKKIEYQQSRGEISLETYKKSIGDMQKRRDKAESTMNGILLRLREKAR
jgi:hypothetical protein